MKYNLEFVDTEIIITAANDGRFSTLEKLRDDVLNLQIYYKVDAVKINETSGEVINFETDELEKIESLLFIPKIKPPRNRDQNIIKDYDCPECYSSMERGYVTSNHSIRWAKNKTEGSIFTTVAETLTPFSVMALKNPKCIGLRCRDCGIVIFKEW